MAWLPKTLRIGYAVYRVQELPPDEKCEGDHDCAEQLIRVRTKDRSQSFAANTLIHEILHGLFYHGGLREVQRKAPNLEEQIVNNLANGLSQVMRDNPDAMRRILKMATSK